MYFGDPQPRSIHLVHAFILGYGTGQFPDSKNDFDCFTEWVATRYHVLADGMDAFHMIVEHVGGDEQKAFDEFFRFLPEYVHEREQIGRDAIISRFCEVQDECMEEFRKKTENDVG